MKNTTKTEFKITGYQHTRVHKLEKKYMTSIRIPTGPEYFAQVTTWIPNTPEYKKPPMICLTVNNYRDKIQILFSTALDLHEFARVLNEFVDSNLKELNNAHTEAMSEFANFHQILMQHSDKKTIDKANNEHNETNENI